MGKAVYKFKLVYVFGIFYQFYHYISSIISLSSLAVSIFTPAVFASSSTVAFLRASLVLYSVMSFAAFLSAYAFDLGYFKSVGILFMLLCLIGYGYSMDFVLNGGNKIKGCTALCKAYFSAACGNGSCAVLGVFHKSEQMGR